MSRCPGPHLLSCGVCGGTDAGLLARAEAAERERDRLRGVVEKTAKIAAALVRYLKIKEETYRATKHTWMIWEIRKALSAALAGEGEAKQENEAACHYCDYEDQEPCFSAFFGYFYCTRPKGHDGVHVACSESKHAVAMVSVDTIPEKAREA